MKYHNRKYSGFDSKKEFRRYQELKVMESAGLISDLQTQVKYVLIPSQRNELGKVVERECSYKADFVYMMDGKKIVEDVKGFKTKEYIIKRKLMLYIHNIKIVEV